MRVTSQMLTTNMMNNVNRNKINMNKKGDRYATGQAIQKPSDDPVVAVRTLKYRSQLTKIDQYLKTNIPEALSWMEITEEALMGVSELVRNINTYCNQGVNGHYELSNRNSIVSTLEEYKEQIFDLGNTDYAGRYVFTGYRTDTPLMFKEATNPAGGKSASWTTYNITENLKYIDVTAKSYIAGGAEYDASKNTSADEYAAMAPSLGSANRLQLSYGNLDIVKGVTFTNKAGETIELDYNVDDNGTITQTQTLTKADGTVEVTDKVLEKVTMTDGTVVETETITNSVTKPDGSFSEIKQVIETATDTAGTVTKTVTETEKKKEIKKAEDGTVIETMTETQLVTKTKKAVNANVIEISKVETGAKTETKKDAAGNIVETITTDIKKEKDANNNIVETRTETTKDADGNVVETIATEIKTVIKVENNITKREVWKTEIKTDENGTTRNEELTTSPTYSNISDPTLGYLMVDKSLADYEEIKPEDYATVAEYNAEREAANPYNAEPNEVVYIEETGELILGSNVMASAAVYTDISVNFDKTEFAKGDLRPEHYFECSTDYYLAAEPDVSKEHINYAEPSVQEIQYELNTNQKLTVNTLAKDSLSTSIVTKIDEIIQSVNSVFNIRDQITEAKKTLQNASTEDEKAAINSYIAQLETEEVLRTQILTESFSSALTTTQKAQEKTDEAVADIGSRYLRGQLIESRLEEQKTTVTELLSDIFYVDLEDAIVEYNAAQVYYNASLMCASKVVQQTLLDYLR